VPFIFPFGIAWVRERNWGSLEFHVGGKKKRQKIKTQHVCCQEDLELRGGAQAVGHVVHITILATVMIKFKKNTIGPKEHCGRQTITPGRSSAAYSKKGKNLDVVRTISAAAERDSQKATTKKTQK